MLSRALEAEPTSIILWIFYLLIYYSNMKSVGEDDMFSCAVRCCIIPTLMTYLLWSMNTGGSLRMFSRIHPYRYYSHTGNPTCSQLAGKV